MQNLPVSPTQFDMRGLGCLQLAGQVLQAYYAVISGQGRVTVRMQERWTEYQKGNANELLQNYCTLYNQCPEAKMAGLPNLNPGNMVRRGPPSRGMQWFPRL